MTIRLQCHDRYVCGWALIIIIISIIICCIHPFCFAFELITRRTAATIIRNTRSIQHDPIQYNDNMHYDTVSRILTRTTIKKPGIFHTPWLLIMIQERSSMSILYSAIQKDTDTNEIFPIVEESSNNNNISSSMISDWLIQNLESNKEQVTSISSTMAGENDTIPMNGLMIGPFRIIPAGSKIVENDNDNDIKTIRLLLGRNGWGTGIHPTTRLCIEFLSSILSTSSTTKNIEQEQEEQPTLLFDENKNVSDITVLDYGCGSGILSITALHMGVKKCYGIDVEAEALITAERNVYLNGYNQDNNIAINQFIPYHTPEVLPYMLEQDNNNGGVDICVANILIGQLIRSSMIIAIMTNVKSNGIICFSGLRVHEVQTLQNAYESYIDTWYNITILDSKDCVGSIDSYGYDCGIWCRIVGRKKKHDDNNDQRQQDILSMSDAAVS